MRKEATALSRAKVLRPILEIEEQGFPVSCALEDAAHDLGLSKSHTWRLYRRMKANDARSSALDLQRRGPKKGTRRLSGEVEQIIECSLIPTVIDQNPCAHLRMPRDMIFHGWSMRLFQAWQHSATMSS